MSGWMLEFPNIRTLEQAADAMGQWTREMACDLCGDVRLVKWDGEQWICGRCEENTESKVTQDKKCTCGSSAVGSPRHSRWCDLS